MKPGLAVLPLEVWADILVYPWITREQLAQIVDKFKNRKFAEKLQFRLHDLGKHSLRYLQISSYTLKKTQSRHQLRRIENTSYDKVLNFLNKIKPLFTDVIIRIGTVESAINLCILFGHLLPMLGSIRQINCGIYYMELLERHIPGILALAKELDLGPLDQPASIPTYLRWLNAPRDFDLNGPKILKITARPNMITALIDAVRKDFLAATAPSTFVILIDNSITPWGQHLEHRAEEFSIENAVTNEQLAVRNFKKPKYAVVVHFVEIMRHSTGAEAKMRDWIKKRAYKKYNKQVISIGCPSLTMGQITKQAGGRDQGEEDKSDGNAAGQSTSAAKNCVIS